MTATAAPTTAGLPPSAGKYWWLALAAGVLSMIIGILALVFPEPTLLAVGLIFGIYLVIWGTTCVMRGASGPEGMSGGLRIVLILLGVLTVFAGLIMIVRPGESVVTLALVLGFWWTIAGVLQLVHGIAVAEGRGWNIGLGLLGIVAGIIILAQPGIGLVTLVWIVGFGLLIQGAIEIAAGWQLRHLHKEGLA